MRGFAGAHLALAGCMAGDADPAACDGTGSGEIAGTASYTCTFVYTFDTDSETGTYTTNTIACDAYVGSGDQLRGIEWDAC